MRQKQHTKQLHLTLFVMVLALFFSACSKAPIKIGMIGSLTSKQSQLSIDARNAIELGVEELNKNGGINGALIELVVKDDGASTEKALEMHQAFANEGVKLVIGHMTSNMTDAVLHSESQDLLFLSPSMSTEKLSNRDDYFLRTSPLTKYQGHAFMDFIDNEHFEHITVVYDMMNQDYTESLALTVKGLSEKNKEMTVDLHPFNSKEDNLLETINQLDLEHTECVFMVAQAMDTAYMAQKIRQRDAEIMLFSVSWSMTQDLIANGGNAVEGLHFVGIYHNPNTSSQLIDFEQSFLNKYGYSPSFISIMAYDAFNVLVAGLEASKSPAPTDVKESLLNIQTFNGLEESFEMDEFGDCNRSYLIYKLIEGEFVPLYQ